jgi:exopolyphosphatase/pppGpp-phosphohydrolase
MLLGVLDIGSNSAQLQVFEARPGAPPLPTHAVKEPTLLAEAFGPDGAVDPAGVAGALAARAAMKALNIDSVDVCPWALREGIILHYLQTTFNQSFDLPLRPLLGSAYAKGRPGARGTVALVAAPAEQA